MAETALLKPAEIDRSCVLHTEDGFTTVVTVDELVCELAGRLSALDILCIRVDRFGSSDDSISRIAMQSKVRKVEPDCAFGRGESERVRKRPVSKYAVYFRIIENIDSYKRRDQIEARSNSTIW